MELSLYLMWSAVVLSYSVQGAHFRGGYISWQTTTSNQMNSNRVNITIQQTYWWIYSRFGCTSLIGDPGYLNCLTTNCSDYQSSTIGIRGPCIDFDIVLDVSVAQSIQSTSLSAGARLVIGYRGAAWLPLVVTTSPMYGLVTLIDLNQRPDNGRINSSPTSTMAALVTVLPNIQQTLRIPMQDIDFDIVKCRWASSSTIIDSRTIDECSGACQNVPGAQLFTSSNMDNNCTLVFTANFQGYYAVALQIEDFMPSAPNGSALSSIPLQFLIRALNLSCNQPKIMGVFKNGETIVVEVNKTFSTSLFAEIGCNSTSITRFWTIIKPLKNFNVSSVVALNSSVYTVDINWTPDDDDIDSKQLFCTIAIDSNTLQSAQYCLNFVVVSALLTTTQVGSTTSTNKFSSKLIWILSLCIPSALLAGLLCACFACQCHKSGWWYVSSSFCFRIHLAFRSRRDSCRRNKKEQHEVTDRSEETVVQSSDSITDPPNEMVERASEVVSPMRTNSMAITQISFLSSRSNYSLPNIEQPMSPMTSRSMLESGNSLGSGSILLHNYLEQTQRTVSV